MAEPTLLLAYLERAWSAQRSDADLLAAIAERKDTVAFTEVVRRYGPLVLGVCRRLLRQPADAEDAFQSTFLVLAQKAASLGDKPQLAGWLHTVARRTALRARQRCQHRAQAGDLLEHVQARNAADLVEQGELRLELDNAVAGLPERYRQVVLCCLFGGASRAQAAAELGLSEGTLSSRLARGRRLLRTRLLRRGITLGALPPSAAISGCLLAQTQGVFRVYGLTGSAGLPTGVAGLTQGVLVTMQLKLFKKFALVGVLLLTGLGFGGWITAQAPNAPRAASPPLPSPATPRNPSEDQEELRLGRTYTQPLQDPLRRLHEQVRRLEEEATQLRDQSERLQKRASAIRDAVGSIRAGLGESMPPFPTRARLHDAQQPFRIRQPIAQPNEPQKDPRPSEQTARIIPLQTADAKEVARLVGSIFIGSNAEIIPVEQDNALYLRGPKDLVADAIKLATALDRAGERTELPPVEPGRAPRRPTPPSIPELDSSKTLLPRPPTPTTAKPAAESPLPPTGSPRGGNEAP